MKMLLQLLQLYVLLRCAAVHYPSAKQLNYSNYTVNYAKHFQEKRKYASIITISMFNSLLSSVPGIITNTHDLMQNSGQTWIFYKLSQTRLTQTKRDPINQMTQPSFNPAANPITGTSQVECMLKPYMEHQQTNLVIFCVMNTNANPIQISGALCMRIGSTMTNLNAGL